MAKCLECLHYEACSGFNPTDQDDDVWHYCKMGIAEEIPDIEKRCSSFKDRKLWAEVVRCKDCKHWIGYLIDGSITLGICSKLMRHTMPRDGFCSCGERKENDCWPNCDAKMYGGVDNGC